MSQQDDSATGNPASTGRSLSGGALAWLIAGAVLLKAALLATSQSGADGDEAVVGIMARHIMEGRGFPLMFYGQDYGGGAVVEALLAIPFFGAFGSSSIALKAAGLAIYAAMLAATGAFAKRSFGMRPAVIAVGCLALWPTFVEWGLKTRGGHVLGLACGMAICHLFIHGVRPGLVAPAGVALSAGLRRRSAVFLMGLLCGLSVWILHINAVLVVVVLLFWVPLAIGRPAAADFLPLAFGGIVGSAPLAWHAVKSDRPALEVLLHPGAGAFAESPERVGQKLRALVEWIGPSFFTPHLDHNGADYHGGAVPVYAGLLCLVALAGAVGLSTSVAAGLRREKPACPSTARETAGRLIAAFIAAYAACCCLIGDNAPRHLLPLAPFLAIAVALLADELLLHRLRLAKLAGATLLALTFSIGAFVHAQWLRRPAEFSGAGSVVEYIAQKDVMQMIGFLRAQGIQYAYVPDHLLEWKILFESREEMVAVRLTPGQRYEPYVRAINQGVVVEGKPYAIVLLNTPDGFSRGERETLGRIIAAIPGGSVRSRAFGPLAAYYGFPYPVFLPLKFSALP